MTSFSRCRIEQVPGSYGFIKVRELTPGVIEERRLMFWTSKYIIFLDLPFLIMIDVVVMGVSEKS